jgi:hypothetical protein
MNMLLFSLVIAVVLVALVLPSKACNPEPKVDLKSAANYVILAKTGITTVVPSAITGDIGVSPIAATAMTGFSFTLEPNGKSAKSTQISGKAYAASYGGSTATELTTAVGHMHTAYNNAKGRSNSEATRKNLGSGVLGGAQPGGPNNQLTPGIYTFDTYVSIGGNLHFNGMCSIAGIILLFRTNILTPLTYNKMSVSLSPLSSGAGVYIIQVASYLSMTGGFSVILENCASAEEIFWQVVGYVTIGAQAHMEGIILTPAPVTFVTESTLNGRIYTQVNVALQKAIITQPSGTANCECVLVGFFLILYFPWHFFADTLKRTLKMICCTRKSHIENAINCNKRCAAHLKRCHVSIPLRKVEKCK